MKSQSNIRAFLFAIFMILAGSGFSGTAEAKEPWGAFGQSYARADQDDARDAVRSGDYISMEQALSAVRGQYPGRLLDADFNRRSGTYLVKMLSEGEVLLVSVDARNGQIMNVRRGGR